MKRYLVLFTILLICLLGYFVNKYSLRSPYVALKSEFGLELDRDNFKILVDNYEGPWQDYERISILQCTNHSYIVNLQKELNTQGFTDCRLSTVHHTGALRPYFQDDILYTMKTINMVDSSGDFSICIVDTFSNKVGYYDLHL